MEKGLRQTYSVFPGAPDRASIQSTHIFALFTVYNNLWNTCEADVIVLSSCWSIHLQALVDMCICQPFRPKIFVKKSDAKVFVDLLLPEYPPPPLPPHLPVRDSSGISELTQIHLINSAVLEPVQRSPYYPCSR